MLLTTIIVGVAGVIVGFLSGIGVGSVSKNILLLEATNEKQQNRCSKLTERTRTDPDTLEKTKFKVRCELLESHKGPHLHVVSNTFSNAGEEIWWE